MVDVESVQKQLRKIGFEAPRWGRREVKELPNVLLPDEQIYEVANGIYEGGFALLIATDIRVLLIDKKPLNYLTVEDLRFDMINEIDYSHRLLGARINIATGNKNLSFLSFTQQRLRKLIGHVQHCMAESKKKQTSHQESQSQHLKRLNNKLQTYLMAQQQYQLQLQQMQLMQQSGGQPAQPAPSPPRPANDLSDYLLAQQLLAQHQAQTGIPQPQLQDPAIPAPQSPQPAVSTEQAIAENDQLHELYREGREEVFGHQQAANHRGLEVNPMRIAYSKLPMVLRNRKFGMPAPAKR